MSLYNSSEVFVPAKQYGNTIHSPWILRWLNTILAVSDEYMSFAKLWQEKGCSSQAETWRVENVLMKDFD